MRSSQSQHGSSLIEVLVTLVVISLGLLGLAGLQLYSMQNTNSATQRYVATTLAYDILERMRSNRLQALAGSYDIALGATGSAGSVAGDDLLAWKDSLAVLPAGDGSISVQGREVTILVQWSDAARADPEDPELALMRLRTEL